MAVSSSISQALRTIKRRFGQLGSCFTLNSVTDWCRNNPRNIKVITGVLLILLGLGLLTPAILLAAGIGPGGVSAASWAAGIQSDIYGAWTGGVFSLAQSLMANISIPGVITSTIAGAGFIGWGLKRIWDGRRSSPGSAPFQVLEHAHQE
ncbi:hypothetical protein DL96DRAFT_1811109 [Flagelloscypha sp. PMI_526]|nr:hypothetical protein DL96DRAFT_1811109 [Flagelloscypha sp. PMI_526]